MHPKAVERFRRHGPFWMPGRSIFVHTGRQTYRIEYVVYMMEEMERRDAIP